MVSAEFGWFGGLAHLGERLICIQEVAGSIPVSSTKRTLSIDMEDFDCIIAVGCSHMFGYEHRSTLGETVPSTDTYADHFGKHLNLPVYNFSQPGASNQTILRRILVALEFLATKKFNALFIIQWTEFTRYETLVPDTVYRAEDWPWLRTMTELTKCSGSDKLTTWAESFYRMYDDKSLLFESLKSIKHANLEIQSAKHKAINCLAHGWDLDSYKFSTDPCYVSSDSIGPTSVYSETLRKWYTDNGYVLDEKLHKEHKTEAYGNTDVPPGKDDIILSLLWKQINDYKWWFYNRGWTYGLKKYCIENGYSLCTKGHPSESAHTSVFEYMLKNNQFMNLLDD